MATTNTFYSNITNNGYKLSLEVRQSAQSIANNTSDIAWVFRLHSTTTACDYNSQQVSATINGQTVYSATRKITIGLNSTLVLASGTLTGVAHNSDGSKTVATAFTWPKTGTGTYLPSATMSGSGNYQLDKIARASSFTIPASTAYGSTMSIAISSADASFTHDITITLPNRTKTYTGVVASQNHTIDINWLEGYTNGQEATGTVSVQTKQGSTLIGSAVSKTFKAPVPASAAPTVAIPAPSITSGLAGYSGAIVGVSSVVFSRNASAKYGASIMSTTWTTDNTSTNAANFTITPSKTSQVITVVVSDSRGLTATTNYTLAASDYSAPNISDITHYRCASDGVADEEGQNIKFTPTFTYTSLGGANTITMTFAVNTTPAIGPTALNPVPTSGEERGPIGAETILKTKSYTLTLVLTDKVGRSSTATEVIPVSEVLFNFPSAGNALGIGMYSQGANRLDVGWDTYVKGNLKVNNRDVAVGEVANGHFGLQNPVSPGSWIRTTEYGFLPYSTTSNTWIGHPDWKFAEGWFKKTNTDTLTVSGATDAGTSLKADTIGVDNADGTNGKGISLWGGAYAGAPNYGLFFGGTATFGTHANTNLDFATYFTMQGNNGRGWIFRNMTTGNNVASINNVGTAYFEALRYGSYPMNNTNLDDYTMNGVYQGYTGLTNAPVQDIAVMEVYRYSVDWVLQRFTQILNNYTWQRVKVRGTTWSAWTRIN